MGGATIGLQNNIKNMSHLDFKSLYVTFMVFCYIFTKLQKNMWFGYFPSMPVLDRDEFLGGFFIGGWVVNMSL